MLLRGSLFYPSLLAQIYTQGPRSPEERLGEMPNPKGIPPAEPARGKEGVALPGLLASFQHMHHTHTCSPESLTLFAKAQTFHVPLTSSLQVTSSRTY